MADQQQMQPAAGQQPPASLSAAPVPVTQQPDKTRDISGILSTYDIQMDGVPDAWSLTCTKVSPKVWDNRPCVLPQYEEMPVIPRSELEHVIADNWGGGVYAVEVRNNGVVKRRITIKIPTDDRPPLTKGVDRQQPPAPDPSDTALRLVDRVLERRADDVTRETLSALRAELAEIKRSTSADTIGTVISSSTQQSIKALELMVANQNASAERAERAAQRQQELLVESMQQLMQVMANTSKQVAEFQGKVFETVTSIQQRETELLRQLLEHTRQTRAEELKELLGMMNLGLSLGSAMAGVKSPEEKLYEIGGRVMEKYLDTRSQAGLPVQVDRDTVRRLVRDVTDELKREVHRKVESPPVPQKPAEIPASSIPAESTELVRHAATAIVRALVAILRDGKTKDELVQVLRQSMPHEVLDAAAKQPEQFLSLLREWSVPEAIRELEPLLSSQDALGRIRDILSEAANVATK